MSNPNNLANAPTDAEIDGILSVMHAEEMAAHEDAKVFDSTNAQAFIMTHINHVDGFNPWEKAYFVLDENSGNEKCILPLNEALLPWFRLAFPNGYIETKPWGVSPEYPMGVCNDTIADVVVSVYNNEGKKIADHRWATAFNPMDPEMQHISPATRSCYLYNVAQSLATIRALKKAGIGMGANNLDSSLLEKIVAKTLTSTGEDVSEVEAAGNMVQTIEEAQANAGKAKSTAAQTAVKKLEEFHELISDSLKHISDLESGKLTGTLKSNVENYLKKSLYRVESSKEDLLHRLGSATQRNKVGEVLTLDAIKEEYERIPVKYRTADEPTASTTEVPTQPVTTSEPSIPAASSTPSPAVPAIPSVKQMTAPSTQSPEPVPECMSYIMKSAHPAVSGKTCGTLEKGLLALVITSPRLDQFPQEDKDAALACYKVIATPDEVETIERRLKRA